MGNVEEDPGLSGIPRRGYCRSRYPARLRWGEAKSKKTTFKQA